MCLLSCFVLVSTISLSVSRLMFNELSLTAPLAHRYSSLMNNQSIVMVGDSLIRYQYLSLVYLIHTNAFLRDDLKPSILWEGDFGRNWVAFYNASNAALFPNEHCDCFRSTLTIQCENRYYFHKERNISISYIGYMGDGEIKIHGHWSPLSNETNHQFRAPLQSFVPYEWEAESIQEALPGIIAKLKPKHSVLYMNAGFWPNKLDQKQHRDSLLDLAVSLYDRVIWKTTNFDKFHTRWPDHGICQYPGIECLDLDWTEHLQSEEYVDKLHFDTHIYTDINIQLILQLTRRSNHTTTYVPMSAKAHGSIVRYQDKHYLVNEKGLLRPFALPSQKDANASCVQEWIKNRTMVHLPASTLRRHLLGAVLQDICTV